MTMYSPKDQKSTTKSNKKIKHKADDRFCRCMTKFVCFIVLPFGLTFLYLDRFVYTTNTYFNEGIGEISIRHFASDLNPVMCQAYEVSSWNPADVFLVSGRAKISKDERKILKRQDSQLFPGSSDIDNAFYLLEGSHIKVNACRRRERLEAQAEKVDILLFKVEDSWGDWKSGNCDACPLKKTTVSDKACEEGGQNILEYQIDERGTYYIAVTTKHGYSIEYLNVRAELEILQTTFDTRLAQQMCHMTKECVFNLTYSSDVDVVMKFGNDTAFNSFTSECKFRVMLWVVIFTILPGCLLALAFCCCGYVDVCFWKKEEKKSVNTELTQSRPTYTYRFTNGKDKLLDSERRIPQGYLTFPHTGTIQAV